MRFKEYLSEASKSDASLKKKADKTGIPLGILRKVYNRGVAAWKSGHRPGTTPEQWGHARVNSFATKSKGTWGGADKDLAAKVRKEETEQLDELSPRTKASYLKKASAQNKKAQKAYNKSVKSSPDAFFGDDSPEDKKRMKTMTKRQKGMAMAKGRKYGQAYESTEVDEILDTPRAMQSYKNKAKSSYDRAAKSAAAKILRGKDKDGKRADHRPELKTMAKRKKGMTGADMVAVRRTFKNLRNEETALEEAVKIKPEKFKGKNQAYKDANTLLTRYGMVYGRTDKMMSFEEPKHIDPKSGINVVIMRNGKAFAASKANGQTIQRPTDIMKLAQWLQDNGMTRNEEVDLEEKKGRKLSPKEVRRALQKAKAQPKDKVSLKKAPWDEQVDEATPMRNLKLVNKVKNSGVVKKGSMSKDEKK